MLKIKLPAMEYYNEETDTFFLSKAQDLQLEHSLISLSKWESKWCKPFISRDRKTIEETKDYIRCMNTSQNVDDETFKYIPDEIIRAINEYIDAEMTATTFSKDDKKVTNRQVITSELIYYWMIAMNIPFECQKWHLNRLLTLINVCNIKNSPPKKMSNKEASHRRAALNASRRKALNSKG